MNVLKSYKAGLRTLLRWQMNLPREWKRKSGGTYELGWLATNIEHSTKVAMIIIIKFLWFEIIVISCLHKFLYS